MADIHAPFHTINRYHPDFKNGDEGATLFGLIDPEVPNLHELWNKACKFLPSYPQPLEQQSIDDLILRANQVIALFPRATFSPEELSLYEGYAILTHMNGPHVTAREKGYRGVTPFQEIPPVYLNLAAFQSKRMLALAGYRLANVLQQMFP